MSTGTQLAPRQQQQQNAMMQTLNAEAFRGTLSQVCAKTIKPARLMELIFGEFQRQPRLLECTPESVLLSILNCAAVGLEVGRGQLSEAYLVARWNSRQNRYECGFMPGYRGLVKLARQSGMIGAVSAEVVYEKDEFRYELGLEPTLKHRRNDTAADPGKILYAYAIAQFRDGTKQFTVLNARELERIKQCTSSRDRQGNIFGPWADHPAEMCKKSAVRRLSKMLPMSVDGRLVDDWDDGDFSRVVDLGATAGLLPAPEEPKALPEPPAAEPERPKPQPRRKQPEPAAAEPEPEPQREPAASGDSDGPHERAAEFAERLANAGSKEEVDRIYGEAKSEQDALGVDCFSRVVKARNAAILQLQKKAI